MIKDKFCELIYQDDIEGAMKMIENNEKITGFDRHLNNGLHIALSKGMPNSFITSLIETDKFSMKNRNGAGHRPIDIANRTDRENEDENSRRNVEIIERFQVLKDNLLRNSNDR